MIAAVSLREYADESSVTGGDVGDTDQEKHSQGQLDDLARGITSHPLLSIAAIWIATIAIAVTSANHTLITIPIQQPSDSTLPAG